jgi:pimeloyl-ACP methyl ester carboxylesterase
MRPCRKLASLRTIFAVVWFVLLAGAICNTQELRRSGFIGVSAAELTDEARKQLKPGETGILVQGVIDGGSAKDSGIQANDIITQVSDHRVVDVDDFVQVVKALRAGDNATIYLRRKGEALTKQLTVKPRPFESAPDVETSYRAISVDGSSRRAIVTAPKGAAKYPAILYVNGIGCFSQESLNLSSPDTKFLYGLTRAGFVTMRVEKSAVGDSEGPSCLSPAVDLRAEIRGYVAGLKALKEYPFVDANRVFIVGISIGGVEAPLIAQQVPVKGLVVINTVAKPFLEYLIDTRRRQNMLRNTPYDEMERRLRLNEQCNHRLLIEREPPDQLLKQAPDCGDYIAYPAPYTYMQQWAALNPAEEWKKVDAPVFIVYGTSDYISTIADDPYLADIINSFHPDHASLKAIPQMDHYLTRARSMAESMNRAANATVEFEPAVLEAVREWLSQRAMPTDR